MKKGYSSFVIPDNVGGRFSVFTPVGLIPLAICGVDIRQLVQGAREMSGQCDPEIPFERKSSGPLCCNPKCTLPFRKKD